MSKNHFGVFVLTLLLIGMVASVNNVENDSFSFLRNIAKPVFGVAEKL